MNKIPHYNAHYDDPQYMADHQMHVARTTAPRSRRASLTALGCTSRATLRHTAMASSSSPTMLYVAFDNGINGLVVHKTDRVLA